MTNIRHPFARGHGQHTRLRQLEAMIAALLTLGLSYYFLYEWFFVRHYWQNRIRLCRYLREGKGDLEYIGQVPTFDRLLVYRYRIEGHTYRIVEVAGTDSVMMDCQNCGREWTDPVVEDALREHSASSRDLIGLFVFSPIMAATTKRIVGHLHRRTQGTPTKLF